MSSTSNRNNNKMATYKWVIANFSKSECKYTPYFGFSIDSEPQFCLYFNPSLSIWVDNWISISICLALCNQDELKVKYRLSFVDDKGFKCNTQEGTSIFKRHSFNALYNIPERVLLDDANGLLVNDTLTVVCEIEMASEDEGLQDFSAISQHYESLLESGKYSDVVLSVGEKDFRAHKMVLCARSPVFAAMFDHSDTKEAQQGRVDIVDIELEVFELLLRYIYSGKIDSLNRFAPEMLTAADRYQMDCLKSLCERYLCSNITTENVCEFLVHANLYNAEVLKRKCINYIAANSKDVEATDGWKKVCDNVDLGLLIEIFEKQL